MNLPFTVDEFLAVFATYNAAIWPAQIVAYGLGVLAVGLLVLKSRLADRLIVFVLSLMWLWTGLVYHIMMFSTVNKAAYGFGAGFILEGMLLAVYGVVRGEIRFQRQWNAYSLTGALFVIYAMLIYPLIGSRLGHAYPRAPMFGVTPCPMTIFTFGLLLWAEPGFPRTVIIIPFVWSVIGFVAALKLGILEDTGLLVAGVVGSLMIIRHERVLTTRRLSKAMGSRQTRLADE